MKLHLPKMLLVAVLASFVNQSARAGWDGHVDGQGNPTTDTYYLDAESTDEVSTVGRADTNLYIRTDNNAEYKDATVGSLVLDNGHTMNIDGSWDVPANDFDGFTLEQVSTAEGNSATLVVCEANKVKLGTIGAGVKVTNKGTVVLQKGSDNIVLNDIVGRNVGTYRSSVIENTATGNIVIDNTGNKTLSGDITIANGGKITLKGGTFGTESAKLSNTIKTENTTILVFEDIRVNIGGDSANNQMLDADIIVGKGATLTMTTGDRYHYTTKHTLEVLTGGSVVLGNQRQTLAQGFEVILSGGTITGVGDNSGIALDFYNGGKVVVKESGTLAANTGGHDNDATIEFDVADGKTLTMTGNLVKTEVTKTNAGTMVYSGAAFAKTLSVNAGVFEYNIADNRTHSGTIQGSGTLRKSGAGTLTLTGAVGSSSDALGKLEVSTGKVVLDTDAYIKNASGSGIMEISAGKTVTFKLDEKGYSILNTIVGQDAELVFTGGNDKIDYGKDKIKVTLNGGTWELGTGRMTLGKEFALVLNGGVVTGINTETSTGDKYGALDFYDEGGKIVSTGTSSITGGVRLRKSIEIDVQSGVLTIDAILNGNDSNSGITKKGDGTLVLTMANTYQDSIYTGSTVMEGGAIRYDISKDVSYAGTISGKGNIEKSGTGHLTLTKVDSLQGNITVDAGKLTIEQLNVSRTHEVTGSVTINHVSVENMMALEEYDDCISYYTTDINGSITGESTNGFLAKNGSLYLFKGIEWEGTIAQGVQTDITTSAGNTLIGGLFVSDVYYVNEGTVILGGTNATVGTVDAAGFAVQTGAKLQVDAVTDGMNMHDLLGSKLSGTGTLLITANNLDTYDGITATDQHAAYSHTTAFGGTLELAAGVTFTLGSASINSQGAVINTDSLTGLVLNHQSTLQYNADGKTNIANVKVVDGAKATIQYKDSNDANAVQLTGKTQLDGDLSLTTTYDGGINIHALVGDGTFSGTSGSGTFNTTIGSLVHTEEGSVSTFSGSLEFSGSSNVVSVSTGNGAKVELNKLSATGVFSFALNVETDTIIHTLNAPAGTVTMHEGATLTLGDGETAHTASIGTLVAHSSGNTVHLSQNTTLSRFAKGANSGVITLTGSGVYDMGTSSTINVSGLTDAQNWHGTVKISNTHIGKLNVDSYGNATSGVEFCGVTTWMENVNTNRLTNLIFSKSADGALNGLTINNNSVQTYNLGGSVSGDGDFTIATQSEHAPNFVFSGDLSAWDGKIKVEQHATSQNTPTIGITLSGGGDIFKADGNGGIEMNRGGEMNVTIGNNSKNTTLNGKIDNLGTGTLNVNVQGNTLFCADVNASKVTVNNGKTASFGDVATISGMGQANAVLNHVELNADGISGTAEDASATDSLIEIKSAATYTIKDIAMSNVTLSAEAKEAYVQMQNVSGDLVLSRGTYEFNTVVVEQPATRSAGTVLNYEVQGTPQITLGTAETQVVLTADPAVDCGQVPGVYDLVFRLDLSLQGEEATTLTGEQWHELVSFGGPLADLLAEQEVTTYLSGVDGMPVVNDPYVFYEYQSNVNQLIVTVHGITAPEPTTATLSLLALAALAARRRRR